MWRKQKKIDAVPKLILEDIIGLTTKNANGFASDASAGVCAYLAGCVIVLYDVGVDARRHLMVSSRVPKPLSCVALARQDRGIVAAGESGPVPAILIWDFSSGSLLSDLKGHQCGVQSIDFSADGKTLVSLGFHNDGYICLWDWKSGKLSAKVKVSTTLSPVMSVSFVSEDNSFVTVGRKHLKLWSVKSHKSMTTSMGKDFSLVDGKPVNLGCHQNRSFVSAVSNRTYCGDHSSESLSIYALTGTGLLCAMDVRFLIKKHVDMEVEKGYSLSLAKDLIACACNNGVVQLFQVESLLYVGSMKYGELSANFSSKDLVCKEQTSEMCNEKNDPIPDAIACQFLSPTRLGVIYADHSFYMWDIDHIQKISKCCVLVSHSACIWDIKNLPLKNIDMSRSIYTDIHEVSFATCSADGTIRQWDFSVLAPSESSREKQEVIANRQIPSSLDDNSCSSVQLVTCGILEHGNDDIKLCGQAFRAMAVSSDGQYLGAGDSSGNLHLFNLQTSTYTCIKDAHRAEIVTINFSKKSHYLVTGSKDRTIHIYDAQRNFDLVESLEDHSAALSSVILAYDGNKLISCGTDKCIYFHDVLMSDTGCRVLRRHNQLTSTGGINDVVVDPSEKIVVTVGQDRKLNKYNLSSGKLAGAFKEEAELGQPVKVLVDPTGSYIVCSYSNKSMRIYDFTTGEAVGQAMGHAEIITGSVFLPDCKHIVSVSGDSCIFIWKLPAILSSKLLQKVKEKTSAENNTDLNGDYVSEKQLPHIEDIGVSAVDGDEDPAFEFSLSRLPKWAQTKVAGESTLSQEPDTKTCNEVLQSKCSNSVVTLDINSSLSRSLKCVDFSQNPSLDQDSSRNLLRRSLNTLDLTGPINGASNGNEVYISTALNGVASTSSEPEMNLTGEKNEIEVLIDKTISATEKQTLSLSADNFEADASFSQKCNNFSLTLKPDGESTGRKNFSGHFHARRYQLLSCKRGVETLKPSHSLDLDVLPNPAAKRAKNSNNRDEETDDALNTDEIPHFDDYNPLIGRFHQRDGPSEGNETDEMYELGKILETLDDAAEKALILCTGLEVEKKRDEMLMLLKNSLPSIFQKVESLNNLVGERSASLELESTVERFAGALSDRVLELLKNKI